MTPEERKILFQRFKQASPRTHAVYGGSGLGLFISKRLADLHGGQIGVASAAGQGSVFVFYVQARRYDASSSDLKFLEQNKKKDGHIRLIQSSAPHRCDNTNSGARDHDSGSFRSTLSRLRLDALHVLVVEDNVINQQVLVQQLKKAGCHVNAANDGIEALAFLKTTHFCDKGGADLSVVLMDLDMPNIDGLTCGREIRKMKTEQRRSAHVPVIAVAANVRDQHIAAAKEGGHGRRSVRTIFYSYFIR